MTDDESETLTPAARCLFADNFSRLLRAEPLPHGRIEAIETDPPLKQPDGTWLVTRRYVVRPWDEPGRTTDDGGGLRAE
jgi:hypothetical protein